MTLSDIIKRMNVVIVDDSQRVRSLMAGLVRGLGCYSVRPYESVALACAAIEDECPTLVLCDWKMAVADGGVFLDRIRTHPDDLIAKMPVIIVTGFGSRDVLVEAMRKGATQFLVKPVVPQELVKKIAFVHKNERAMVRYNGRMVYVQDRSKRTSRPKKLPEAQGDPAPVSAALSGSSVWKV